MSAAIEIKPQLINWAISRAGYETGEFYERFPRAKDWLEENKKPTLPQLRDFAKKVHVPFGYLFLQEPPKEKLSFPFFRTLGGETEDISINLRDSITILQKRQDWIKEYLKEQGADPLDFIGKYTSESPVEEVVADIKNVLGLYEDWADTHSSWEKTLNHLSEVVEEAGIFIVFNGVVENNTRRPITVDECRGFVLCDEYAPFLFVNTADSKSAQMFTIVHELAHLWIGKSAGFDFRLLQPANDTIEKFCDSVSAEFLVPANSFHLQWEITQSFEDLAKKFKVSPIVVARRALDLGKINKEDFFQFYNEYMGKYYEKKEEQAGGGNFYATLRRRLNIRFLSTVNRAVKENKLLYRHAYDLTGLKGGTYEEAVKRYNL